MSALLLGLALGGCWLSDAEIDAKVVDVEVDPLAIGAVVPDHGTDAGGTLVEIQATPIGEGVTVRFGDLEAEVIDLEGDRVFVETPVGSAGLADLEVTWGLHEGQLEGAYRYFPDATGLYGAVGAFAWYEIVGSLADHFDDRGFAWMNFVSPTPHHYGASFGPSLGTCASGWTYPAPRQELTHNQRVELAEASAPVSLIWDRFEGWYAADLGLGAGDNGFLPATSYALEPVGDGDAYPVFTVDDMVQTPEPFVVDRPDLYGSEPPVVSRGDFRVEWTTPGKADFVFLRIDAWNFFGNERVEQVRCLVPDDGHFVIPSTAWQRWNHTYLLDIYVGRARLSEARLPHDESMSGVAGVWWVVGEAYPL